MYLNASSFMTILEELKSHSTTQYKLYEKVFKSIEPRQSVSYIPSNIKSGRNDIPSDVSDAISQRELHQDQLIRFKNEVLPFFEENLNTLIGALFLIIEKDKTITDTVKIGARSIEEWKQYTGPIYADSFIYEVMAFSFSRNNRHSSATEGINERFLDNARKRGRKMELRETTIVEPLALGIPLNARFQAVFHEIPVTQDGRSINIRLFHLDIENNLFAYAGLVRHFRKNLFRHVHSKNEITGYYNDEDIGELHLNARTQLEKCYKDSSTKVLESLLVESCLTDASRAPKIINVLEHDNKGIPSGSHGIHYMKSNSGQEHQLLVATASMTNNIYDAFDNVFADIKEIVDSGTEWKNILFSQSMLLTRMSADDARWLAETFMPKSITAPKTKIGYGVFIGYKSSADMALDVFEKELAIDLQNRMPKLQNCIKSIDLESTPFFIYFIPFNDANADKELIIEEIIR